MRKISMVAPQSFMKFLSFDLIIEVRKTENFSFLAPTIYNIWKLEVLGNFTPCLILKKLHFRGLISRNCLLKWYCSIEAVEAHP